MPSHSKTAPLFWRWAALEGGATAEVRDRASLRTNTAAYGGCASVTSGASLVIRDDVELTACNASLGGGGLYVDDALFTALGAGAGSINASHLRVAVRTPPVRAL